MSAFRNYYGSARRSGKTELVIAHNRAIQEQSAHLLKADSKGISPFTNSLKDCALRVLWAQFQSSSKGSTRYQLKKQQFLARNYGTGLRKLHEMAKGKLNA